MEKLSGGKTKTLFTQDDPNQILLRFGNDTTAGDGAKHSEFDGKGAANCATNALIMQYLEARNVNTHFISQLSSNDMVVHKLEMLPVECVIRNIATGSLCKRLGVEAGQVCDPPLFEFFLKNDELHDPLITEDHIKQFGWATEEQMVSMRQQSYTVNRILSDLFNKIGLKLIDFKLEFGYVNGQPSTMILGDEFTLDGCRLWDENGKSWDKDLFRKAGANVTGPYQEVLRRLEAIVNG